MAVKSEDREILRNWINLEKFKVEVKLKVVYDRWMDPGGQWGRDGDIGGGSKEGGGDMWDLFKNHLKKKKKWVIKMGAENNSRMFV